MNRREKIQFRQLEALDAKFRELLIVSLQQCSRGRWGLFGTFDYLGEARKYWNWPEADRLRELAVSIEAILAQFGEQNALCREFLELCENHGQNDPGDPTLARAFLDRIEKGEVGSSKR